MAFSYNGSLHVGRPSIFGLHVQSDRVFVIFLAVVFAVVGVLLLVLRRGPFGRLLYAMKDSETACTTLGLNLTVTKLAVFAMSASIAGLGGALLGAMSTRAGGTDFASEASLPILLLVVLGGVATVSGALYGGLAYGLGLAVLQKLLPVGTRPRVPRHGPGRVEHRLHARRRGGAHRRTAPRHVLTRLDRIR